jgi:hypothetical protein
MFLVDNAVEYAGRVQAVGPRPAAAGNHDALVRAGYSGGIDG